MKRQKKKGRKSESRNVSRTRIDISKSQTFFSKIKMWFSRRKGTFESHQFSLLKFVAKFVTKGNIFFFFLI